jgi:hypothetical protein
MYSLMWCLLDKQKRIKANFKREMTYHFYVIRKVEMSSFGSNKVIRKVS